MILGIDAHCIRGSGGGVTHLRDVLKVCNPAAHGFEKVVLWAGTKTLDQIEARDWLEKKITPALDGGLARRTAWSAFQLAREARNSSCAVVWSPGCTYSGTFRPFVAMSRNMLPMDLGEAARYAPRPEFWKFLALRRAQLRTFRRCDGMIYLTDFARHQIEPLVGRTGSVSCVIPHGISDQFQPASFERDASVPIEMLYVSAIDRYKHQWHVIEATKQLQAKGFEVNLTLAGPIFPAARKRFQKSLASCSGTSIRYIGEVAHSELPGLYLEADLFVYASSCENLPNILLEAMACGLPIACSARGPMPEILGDGGLYFDPESPAEIAAAIEQYIASPTLRAEMGARAYALSRAYSWERCANETFAFLAHVAKRTEMASAES